MTCTVDASVISLVLHKCTYLLFICDKFVVICFQHLRSQLDDLRDCVSFGAEKQTAAQQFVALYETLRNQVP